MLCIVLLFIAHISILPVQKWFEAYYAPDQSMEISASAALGRNIVLDRDISPVWEQAVQKDSEYYIPIPPTSFSSYKGGRREEVKTELVVSCGRSGYSAVIRHYLSKGTESKRFSGIVLDTDPNTHEYLSVQQYENGTVVFEEPRLDDQVNEEYSIVYYRDCRTQIHRKGTTYKRIMVVNSNVSFDGLPGVTVTYLDSDKAVATFGSKGVFLPEVTEILKKYKISNPK